jgi:hypothetical protein
VSRPGLGLASLGLGRLKACPTHCRSGRTVVPPVQPKGTKVPEQNSACPAPSANSQKKDRIPRLSLAARALNPASRPGIVLSGGCTNGGVPHASPRRVGDETWRRSRGCHALTRSGTACFTPDGSGMKHGVRNPRTRARITWDSYQLRTAAGRRYATVVRRPRRSPLRPILPAGTVDPPLLHSCDEVADDPTVSME